MLSLPPSLKHHLGSRRAEAQINKWPDSRDKNLKKKAMIWKYQVALYMFSHSVFYFSKNVTLWNLNGPVLTSALETEVWPA